MGGGGVGGDGEVGGCAGDGEDGAEGGVRVDRGEGAAGHCGGLLGLVRVNIEMGWKSRTVLR